jgi:hypothetical protein
MQDNEGCWGWGRRGKAMPLDMPQGKNKRLPKSLAGTPRLLWELLCPAFFRRGEWKLCFDKKGIQI